jgi:hypothetical protein
MQQRLKSVYVCTSSWKVYPSQQHASIKKNSFRHPHLPLIMALNHRQSLLQRHRGKMPTRTEYSKSWNHSTQPVQHAWFISASNGGTNKHKWSHHQGQELAENYHELLPSITQKVLLFRHGLTRKRAPYYLVKLEIVPCMIPDRSWFGWSNPSIFGCIFDSRAGCK